MSPILRQSRYLLSYCRVGSGAVRGFHCMLLCANLQATIPSNWILEPAQVQGQFFQPERRSEVEPWPQGKRDVQ